MCVICFQGTIVDCDMVLAVLHGFQHASDLIGINIKTLIPALVLPSCETLNKAGL